MGSTPTRPIFCDYPTPSIYPVGVYPRGFLNGFAMKPRIVFMGSPEFSVPILRALHENYTIAGVVTQPDKPAGRGRISTPSPVKLLAEHLNIPLMQPIKLSSPESIEQLHAWNPDVIIVAAFGQILRSNVLELPPKKCINVHASYLPRWRGAAPIQAAILHGDQKTGITIMLMDTSVDTGLILSQKELQILPDDTTETLSERLSILGASLLLETLPRYLNGELEPVPQMNDEASYAPLLKKEDGLLDFNLSAEYLMRKIRAYNPWPGAYMLWNNQPLKIFKASLLLYDSPDKTTGTPGRRIVIQEKPAIRCNPGILLLEFIQQPGKKAMSAKEFLRGVRNWISLPQSKT